MHAAISPAAPPPIITIRFNFSPEIFYSKIGKKSTSDIGYVRVKFLYEKFFENANSELTVVSARYSYPPEAFL